MEGIYPWLPLRCPLSNGCFVSLEKFWSQSLGGLSTKWGTGTQSISCKNLAHWRLLTFRDLFLTQRGGALYTCSTRRKKAQSLPIHPHPVNSPNHTSKALPGGQTRFGKEEASPEAQGVNSCTEGCVLWSQHLRRREGAVGREGRSLRS